MPARHLAPCMLISLLLILEPACTPALTHAAAAPPDTTATGVVIPPLPAQVPADAARFTVLLMGKTGGRQATWVGADGRLHIVYYYVDRGRGPSTESVLTLGADGVPRAEEITGHGEMTTAVHETYALEGRTARWKNAAEEGRRALDGPALYAPLNAPPAELAVMVRAALAAGGAIALLPEGRLAVEKVDERDITAAGTTRHLTLYALNGLDFAPQYAWLDAQLDFVAMLNGWITVFPEGWEAAARPLQEAQDRVSQARGEALARRLAHAVPGGLVFRHATLFDAAAGARVPDRDVVVREGRIVAVVAGGQADTVGARVVDARGGTLLPGLWDMHAHVSDYEGLLNLAAGITTVRDLANDTDELLARKKRIEEGREIGTRIVLAGVIDGPGPFQAPTKVLVATEEEARAAVRNYQRLGYVQIKIYSSVDPALVPPIIDEAHKLGLRVSGHIPAGMTAAECVRLGFDEIQHANFLMLNFMPDVRNTNGRARFVETGRRGGDLDVQGPAMDAFIELLKSHHTVLDPTLTVFEGMYATPVGRLPAGFEAVAPRLPPQVRRGLAAGGQGNDPDLRARYRRTFTRMMEMIARMHRAGIPLVSGTDNMAGFALLRELELHAQAGQAPAEVLADATLNAARIMHLDAELGSIMPGKLADLVLVEGNPLARIADIRRTRLVVKDGAVYEPRELYEALGVRP